MAQPQKVFTLVTDLNSKKHSEGVTLHQICQHIVDNHSNWADEGAMNTSLVNESLMESSGIAFAYNDDAGLKPQTIADLASECARILRLQGEDISSVLSSVSYEAFAKETNGTQSAEFIQFSKRIKSLKERLDTTIASSADELVTTVATYVKSNFDSMTENLPVNVSDAEVQNIAAGIAERFAEEFAAKIQEKLGEINVDG